MTAASSARQNTTWFAHGMQRQACWYPSPEKKYAILVTCPPVTRGWVVADGFAAKLPPMIQVHLVSKKAASRTSIAFGTDDGQLIIIHHPSGISTRPLIEHMEESISGGSYQLNSVTDGELDINQHRLEELQDFQVIDRQDTFLKARNIIYYNASSSVGLKHDMQII